MRYAVCPRCWLKLRERDEAPVKKHCPRCLGRIGMQVPLYLTAGMTRIPSPIIASPDAAQASEAAADVVPEDEKLYGSG